MGGVVHDCLVRLPGSPRPGYTPVTRIGEAERDTGMEFGILRLEAGERWTSSPDLETACLLTDGTVRLRCGGEAVEASRTSLFDGEPAVAHHAAGDTVEVHALGAAELAVVRVENPARFPARTFEPGGLLEVEHRDRGRWEDAAWRVVRTVFDLRNRPESLMVIGEVVTLPGRWSSYPPHHHPQPEIYHYRFDRPQGYGHAELGDEVVKVRSRDTVKILDLADHSQVAAPGYAMWYLWAIRHLPGEPYVTPEFAGEHRWLKEPGARAWRPGGDDR